MEQDLVGRSIGNYAVQKHLGAGGMGTVYKPEVVDRFFHEAKAATEIGHPSASPCWPPVRSPRKPRNPQSRAGSASSSGARLRS